MKFVTYTPVDFSCKWMFVKDYIQITYYILHLLLRFFYIKIEEKQPDSNGHYRLEMQYSVCGPYLYQDSDITVSYQLDDTSQKLKKNKNGGRGPIRTADKLIFNSVIAVLIFNKIIVAFNCSTN